MLFGQATTVTMLEPKKNSNAVHHNAGRETMCQW